MMAPLPYTNLRETKIRPVVILADVGNSREPDWIVCEVTTSSRRRPRSVPLTNDDILEGRLTRRSWARPDRVFTVEETAFIRKIGSLTNAKLTEILTATRALF